jgi:anti-sigma factor RsiW
VSHLEEQISALIDGELTGADLDRANAHLAGCERCRAEAAALRLLKRQLRALATPFDLPVVTDSAATDTDRADGQRPTAADEELTRRLLAMAGPGGPVPSRRFRREQFRHARLANRGERPSRAARGRYLVWTALSLVVVGIGATAFSMGGGGGSQPGPKVTPQLEKFSLEHAVQTGDIPFPYPTQALTARP